MSKKDNVEKNIIVGFGGQLIILVLGIIVPRIMLTNYGSDVNGLISTITQIFTYMALLEAGIGQAARNALYKPIAENNRQGISHIASIAQSYFRKLTAIYGIGVILLALIVPFVIKSGVDKATICLVILFQGLAGVISFYFIQTQAIILDADGHGYINNGINVINQILSYSARIILAFMGINIAVVQFSYFLITIAKVIVYKAYFNRHYSWLDYSLATKEDKLKDRNAYIVTEIAWTLFSSTDMIVLSTFISTQLSSVYAIYNMVFTSLNVLLNAVYSSLVYILGQTFHEDIEKYKKVHDVFTSIFLGAMTIMMCVAYVLCIPFVRLYTDGVTDITYVYHELPLLFCLIQIISWSRFVSGNLTGIAGYAKQTGWISLIEAITNVLLSVLLVNRFGLVGVLIATVVSLPLKVVWCIYIADKKVMHRPYGRTLSILVTNYLLFFAVVLLSRYCSFEITSYISLGAYALLLSITIGIVGVLLNLAVNRDCLQIINRYILKR